MKTLEVLEKEYTFDPNENRVLKRGLIDPYLICEDDNQWVVLDDYVFWSARIQKPIVVPKWFVTDLASIPKGLRWLISVNERHRLASLPHDILYALSGISGGLTISRKDADLVLNDFCLFWDVPFWKRYSMYGAVRVGGRFAFEKKKEPFFAPRLHKQWYIENFPDLNLTEENGFILTV